MKNIVLINNSRIAWLQLNSKPYLSFSDSLLQAAYIIFEKSVDNSSIILTLLGNEL